MTLFDGPIGPDTYAVIRFGLGYPALGAPLDASGMIAALRRPDRMAALHPKLTPAEMADLGLEFHRATKQAKSGADGARARLKAARHAIRLSKYDSLRADFTRMAETDDPFRERLVMFWANHFATRAKGFRMAAMVPLYSDHALRPHVAGRFADLLISAVTHPVMLLYLDQPASVGPNSEVAAGTNRGLNENLAREILELHTLGVGAGYSQFDVTQFAELLTGLFYHPNTRVTDYRPNRSEPGAETVLGRSYGGPGAGHLRDIHAALEDLARHPATAAHLSRKLATHFIADAPEPGVVAAMTSAWLDSDGDLSQVYAAMLAHPAAWRGLGAKVKRPFDFMASAVRALGRTDPYFRNLSNARIRDDYERAMRAMGQDYLGPPGPDGYPEEAEAWVQPLGIARRIQWAMDIAHHASGRDPVAFAHDTLGPAAGERLLWAAARAETREQGIALVLASAEFNRR